MLYYNQESSFLHSEVSKRYFPHKRPKTSSLVCMFKGSKFCVQENYTRLAQPCPFPCFCTQTTSWEEHSERGNNNNNHEKESKSRHKRSNRPLLIQYQTRSHDRVRFFHVDIKIFPTEPGFQAKPLFPLFVASNKAGRSSLVPATAA